MTKGEIKDAVLEAFAEHQHCLFNENERRILKDVAEVGKKIKSIIFFAIATSILGGTVVGLAVKAIAG